MRRRRQFVVLVPGSAAGRTRDRLFAALLVWSGVAGSLLGWGQALHVTPLFIAGVAMSVVCPLGVLTALWLLGRRRGGEHG